MSNGQEIQQRVSSEVLIFQQKPQPRKLSNPKATGFSLMENHLELLSDEDFAKANSMIGEFLKLSYVKLPPAIEMTGNVTSSSMKHTSRPSAVTKHVSPAPKKCFSTFGG